jgi:hypothetical protein
LRSIKALILAMCAISLMLATAGIASADDYAGLTYKAALEKINKRNATAVISTVVGGEMVTEDCMVTSGRKSGFLDASDNGAKRSNEVLLNLNCSKPMDRPVPGPSVASEEGKKAKKYREQAQYYDQHPDECYASDDVLAYCQRVCDATRLCEIPDP